MAGTRRRAGRSRSRSRSRSITRKRRGSRVAKAAKRKDKVDRRRRGGSQDSISGWKIKDRRRGVVGVVDKAASSKKAKDEQAYLAAIGNSDVFTTYDAIFIVAKYLLQLKEGGALPLDVYAIRRGLSGHFSGPRRLRLNTVCSINALSAILKYLWMDKSGKKGGEGELEAEKIGKRTKRGKPDGKRNDDKESDGKDDSYRNAGVDGDDGDGEHDDHDHEEDEAVEEDEEVKVDGEEDCTVAIDYSDAADSDRANEDSQHEKTSLSSLEIYFQQLPETVDQSFRALNFDGSVINLDVKDGLLYVTGVKVQHLRKLILRNRKKDRMLDFGDSFNANEVAEDDVQEEAEEADGQETVDHHITVQEEDVKDEEFTETDMDTLYKALFQNTAREMTRIAEFQLRERSGFRHICPFGTRTECRLNNRMSLLCDKVHFKKIILPNTLVQLGDCSYLDTCRHIETCRFVHYQVEYDLPLRPTVDEVSKGQWICCDVRKLDFSIFNPYVSVIMADPPWDIHMDLPYGTMKDSEMKSLRVQNIQNEGLLFLWVTGRTLEVGRECMEIWGYRQVDEVVWVKTNQLQRIIRTGRTGHWLNHSKEHCLIGIKGNPVINRYIDCDVVVSEVRETSRKPDEIYRLIERMVPGALKLEIFGRSHNVRNNWITLGNQLDGYNLTHPEIKSRYEELIAQAETSTAAAAAAGESPRPDTANEPTAVE